MASSPEPDHSDPAESLPPWSPDHERVPRPWLAIAAVTLAVVTILGFIIAAVVAGFVVDR